MNKIDGPQSRSSAISNRNEGSLVGMSRELTMCKSSWNKEDITSTYHLQTDKTDGKTVTTFFNNMPYLSKLD